MVLRLPLAGEEKTTLHVSLIRHRAAVPWKLEGLDDTPAAAHRRSAWPPHSPSLYRPCDRHFLRIRRLPHQARRN